VKFHRGFRYVRGIANGALLASAIKEMLNDKASVRCGQIAC
jgi:hypothetical protein